MTKYDTEKYSRFSFLAGSAEKMGISSEFAHSKVVAPVATLLDKCTKAASIRFDDQDNRLAVDLLTACAAEINKVVHGPSSPAALDANEPEASPSFRR